LYRSESDAQEFGPGTSWASTDPDAEHFALGMVVVKGHPYGLRRSTVYRGHIHVDTDAILDIRVDPRGGLQRLGHELRADERVRNVVRQPGIRDAAESLGFQWLVFTTDDRDEWYYVDGPPVEVEKVRDLPY